MKRLLLLFLVLSLCFAAPAFAQTADIQDNTQDVQSESIDATQSESLEPIQSESIDATQSESLEPIQSESIDATQSESLEATQSESLEATQSESNGTSQFEQLMASHDQSYEDSDLDAGIALGYSFPFSAILDFSLQYRFTSFYRLGIEDKIGGLILFFQNQLFLMNEFDVYRGQSFNFGVRIGLGWSVYFGGVLDIFSKNKEITRIHAFTIPVGLDFSWRINQKVSLRVLLDVNNNIYGVTQEKDENGKETSKITYIPLPDLLFGVLIHI